MKCGSVGEVETRKSRHVDLVCQNLTMTLTSNNRLDTFVFSIEEISTFALLGDQQSTAVHKVNRNNLISYKKFNYKRVVLLDFELDKYSNSLSPTRYQREHGNKTEMSEAITETVKKSNKRQSTVAAGS